MRRKIMSILLAMTMVMGTPAAVYAEPAVASASGSTYLDKYAQAKEDAAAEEEAAHTAYSEAAFKKSDAANALQQAQEDESEKEAAYGSAMGDSEQKKNEAEADYQTKESEYQAALQTQSVAQTKVDETAKTKAAKETAYQDARQPTAMPKRTRTPKSLPTMRRRIRKNMAATASLKPRERPMP